MTRSAANLLLLLAAAMWGAGNVSQKLVLDSLGPFTTVGLRCLIGALVILPFVGGGLAPRLRAALAAPWPAIWTSLLFAFAIVLQQTAYATTSVTNGSFLIAATTVFTPLAAWLLYRVRPAPLILMAAPAALAGSFLMAGGALVAVTSGDLLCLAAAVVYSVWFVVLGEAVVRTGQPATITLIQFVATGALCLAIGLASETNDGPRLAAALPHLAVLGVLATGGAYVLQSMAQRYTSATEAAILTGAESLFGTIAAMYFLSERMTGTSGIGALLIVIAMLIVQVGPAPAAAAVVQAGSSRRR